MSNDEASPVVEAERSCVDEAAEAGIELLLPREVPLGGPRAMPVLRVLPNKHRHMVGAWCFADAFGPEDVAAHGGMDVPPHPHTGLQTVSWLVAGRIEHRDSLGSVHTVAPGGVNVMTAGRGIAHSEHSTPETTSLHGVQLWVALPESQRGIAPHFAGLDAVPIVAVGDATVQVFAGASGDLRADVPVHTPILGAEVRLPAGGSAAVPADPAFEHGVLALADGVVVDGVPVPVGGMAVLAPGADRVPIAAAAEAAGDVVAILLGGEPFAEEVVMFWNFVGTTHDDVAAARETWMQERQAADASRDRFGTVPGGEATLPSPRLPDVELLPRGRAKRR
ncbi:pirin family protein [Agrococcus versicolor]|uniref:Pirin family protein n=1 Tax=Agrococcus versicolor TaxID=501482 RepID=A0ABP5MAV0_9MICO